MQFNRMPFQETGRYFQGDFPSVSRPLVKKSFQPTRVEMLPLAMKQAFGLLRTGRPGPVNIDVPLNVFQESADVEIPDPDRLVKQRSPGDLTALDQALDLLLAAKRPVKLVGQGGLIGEATEMLIEFLKLMRIPVVTSPNGKGTLDETSELSFGAMGRNGPYAANEATRNADVLLALGCRFDDRATSAWITGYTLAIPPTKLIQIDKTKKLVCTDFVMLARSMGVDGARVDRVNDLEGVLETAIKANRPYLVEVPVGREIRPVGTGTWQLPPIPHGEPNFRQRAGLDK